MADRATTTQETADGRTLRHQHRRPELLAVVAEHVLDTGISELALRPTAQAIGVTHATLLRHFGSKEELIGEVVAKIRSDLATQIEAELSTMGAASPGELMLAAWNHLTSPAELRQFLLLYELTARHGHDVDSGFGSAAHLASEVADAVARQLEQRLGVAADQASAMAQLAVAQIRGMVIDLVLTGDRSRADRAMELFIELLDQSMMTPVGTVQRDRASPKR